MLPRWIDPWPGCERACIDGTTLRLDTAWIPLNSSSLRMVATTSTEPVALGERLPQAHLRVSPRAERCQGVMAGIGVDEQRVVGIKGDRQLERAVTLGAACSTAIEPKKGRRRSMPSISNAPTF